MVLRNGDTDVLYFSLDDSYIQVLDNDYLPLELKDWLKTTNYSTVDEMRKSIRYLDALKDFLVSRTLNLSKVNAKAILDSVSLPQSSRIAERLTIVLACDALSMIDNFWVANDDDTRKFKDVCLRNHKLEDAAFKISIAGIIASATNEELKPDLTSDGMFPKTWYRGIDKLEMWKTDSTSNFVNTEAEYKVSQLLDYTNVNHVEYTKFVKDERILVRSECLATDEFSIVNAFSLQDWCSHNNLDLVTYLEQNFISDFAKMCVIDYVVANTDRHLGNVHFFVDNRINKIVKMTPLLDFNQALVADYFKTNVDDLVYDITGKGMLETAKKYFPLADLEIDITKFPLACQKRYERLIACTPNHLNCF